jgi:outer membrane biosynthesis protein TonB
MPAAKTPAKAGASSFDQLFAKGIPGGSAKGRDQTSAASQASAQQVASWSSSINSRVRGPWNSCPVNGLDVGKLRASVRFTLDPAGRVQSIEDFEVTGVTEANRPQVKPFKDCAIRAIRLAAPFAGLPAEFHAQWKNRRLNFRKE